MKREFYQASALLAATLLVSCAGPRASGVRYSPPSAAPVRDKISSAQSHSQNAAVRVAHASRVLVSASRGNNLPAPISDALNLATADLAAANSEIDALTSELLDSQTALKDFEKKVADQTQIANTALDDKNTAISQRDAEKAKTARVAKREHRFFLLLCAALVWIFRTPLLYLLKLLLALITKIPI